MCIYTYIYIYKIPATEAATRTSLCARFCAAAAASATARARASSTAAAVFIFYEFIVNVHHLSWLYWSCSYINPWYFRSGPKCLKHPAGPRQKSIDGGAVWVVRVWLQIFWIRNVLCVLPALNTGFPACHVPHSSASNNWFCEPYPTNWKNANKSVPTKFLAFLNKKTKFPEGF